ncbi:MAG TPA: S8 family serine peptidase, partial [Ilumatobacteraceae bacterium]|nr:S8 family serine peptidase [Ilumatobacteraceae bacterium]
MNKLGALLIIGGVAIGPCLPLDAFVAASSPSPIEASATVDRYIVQFAAGTDPDREAAELSGLGVEVAEVYHDVFPGAAVFASADLVAHIRTDATVVRVEPDQMITLDAVPPTVVQPDPPWGLDRIDQRSLPLSNTYSYNDDGSGVTAYIIDSGINAAHVDFGGRVRSGISTVGDTPSTDDCVGHGTHVAGIVGGQTYGVAKNVSLVAVRVLDCNGTTSGSQLIQGLDWVVADHQAGTPAVANLSIGGLPSEMVDNAVQALINDGVTVAIAAGNESKDACNVSPSRLPAAITVAASTETDARSVFSNFGPCVDLFAPGSNIPSDFRGSPTATAIE